MSNRYELTTLQDIFDKIPLDKIELCMQELGAVLFTHRSIADFAKAVGQQEGIDIHGDSVVVKWPITWIDDDESSGSIRFVNELGDYIGGELKVDLRSTEK